MAPADLHVYMPDPGTPGVCTCRLIETAGVHVPGDDPRIADQQRRQAEHRRRAGDNEEDA